MDSRSVFTMWILMREVVRFSLSDGGEEGLPKEDQAGGDEERAGNRRRAKGRPCRPFAVLRSLQKALQQRLFGDETEQRRQAGHRDGGQERNRRGHRKRVAQPGQSSQVPGACGMVDDARDQKEGPFVERVGEDADDNGQHCGLAAECEESGENAQLADGRIGEQRLHVPLTDGDDCAEKHRDAANREKRPRPSRMVAEGRMQASQQVDSRLDHCCRVEIGACGRRRGHGAGKPPVEGELGGLGEGAQQNQRQNHRVERQFGQPRTADDLAERIGAAFLTQENQARQQRESASRSNDEGVARAATGDSRHVPVADE